MNTYLWGAHMFGWMAIIPLGFMAICLFFLFVYLFRGPRRFWGRREREDLEGDARALLNRRYAHGEISKEQYEQLKRGIGGGKAGGGSRAPRPRRANRSPARGDAQDDHAVPT